jgi:hypothetical protein
MKIMAAVIALGLSGPAMAQDTGTIRFLGAGMNCFKIQIEESGLKYAVDYASTATETAMGWISIFSDYFGTVMTIETDGTQPKDCGNGTFYRITGLQF